MDTDSDSEMDGPLPSNVPDQAALVIDGMAACNEQTVFKAAIKNCNDLASYFVQAIECKGLMFESVCVVFDNYSVKNSLKATTRSHRTGGKSSRIMDYKVDDCTAIRDVQAFLSSTATKDQLTIYLANSHHHV